LFISLVLTLNLLLLIAQHVCNASTDNTVSQLVTKPNY